MKFLVIGGTGTVGSQVVKRLLEEKSEVRVFSRSGKKVPQGVESVQGDMSDMASLTAAFDGVDGAFFLVPIGPKETENGLNVVSAAVEMEVPKLVYMSVTLPEDSTHIPHFGSKVPIEQAIMTSGLHYTILRPNNFFQNDYFFKDAILNYGIYPQPIGEVGVRRVDVRDIADAAVNALTEPGHNGKIYELQGPEDLTGPQVAEIYSRHLGRDIRYGGNDLDAWSEQARKMLPDWMVEDYRIMYEYFQTKGLRVPDNPDAPFMDVLKHEPRNFESFVEETSKMWLAEAVERV